MAHVELGAIGAVVQLSLSLKSPVFATWVTLSGTLPIFVTVIGCAALTVATACVPKVSATGLSEITGCVSVLAVSKGICQMPRPYVAARNSPARPSPVGIAAATASSTIGALGKLVP